MDERDHWQSWGFISYPNIPICPRKTYTSRSMPKIDVRNTRCTNSRKSKMSVLMAGTLSNPRVLPYALSTEHVEIC